MTQVNISQKSFSAGEISPDLEGRTDLKKYNNALSTSLNVMCTNKGDLIPRPGTEFVAFSSGLNTTTGRAPNKSRIIPFKISENDSYILDFSDKRMRIFKDSKPILGSTDTINVSYRMAPVITTTYASTIGAVLTAPEGGFSFLKPNEFPYEEGDGPFYFTFNEGVMQGDEFQQTFGDPAELSFTYASSSWPGKTTTEFDSSHAIADSDRFWIHSVVRNAITSSPVNGSTQNEKGARSRDQVADIVYITDSYANVGIEGSNLLVTAAANANQPVIDFSWTFERKLSDESTQVDYFDSPFEESEIDDIQYAPYGDSMYIVHKNRNPMILKRVGEQNFRFTKFRFKGGPWRESSTYGEGWQGHVSWSVPQTIEANSVGTVEGMSPPVAGNEIQAAAGGLVGKLVNEIGATVSIYLTDQSPSLQTADSGYTASSTWIGRKVRIKFNVGQNPGITKFTGSTNLNTERQGAIANPDSSADGDSNNVEQGFRPSNYETTSFLWAEGEVLENRYYTPAGWTSNPPSSDLLFEDASSRLYIDVASKPRFLNPGDIISVPVNSGSDYPNHTVVVKSATEPRELKTNEWYVHSIVSTTQILICDSFTKVGVAGQNHTSNYTALSGTLNIIYQGLTNPARKLRIKLTKPFNFTQLAGGNSEDFAWLKPSNETRIGHLFEDPLPDGTGGWPKTVCLFDNRLFFGASDEFPSMIAASSLGDFENFSPDDSGSNSVSTVNAPHTQTDWSIKGNQNPRIFPNDSFTYSLQEGTSDSINWMKATPNGLIIATNNSIYVSEKPKRNEAYGPSNWKLSLVSEEGSSNVLPEYIDGRLYYVNFLGDKLLSLQYSTEADSFRPIVESILSEHIIKDGITSMAFARSPIQVLWLTLNNGDLVSVVLLETEEQKAFFRHNLASPGAYSRQKSLSRSIAVIPSEDKKFDQLWISAERYGWSGTTTTPDENDTNGNFNSIEKLTQYNPYLSDTLDFVGLDFSVTSNSERYRLGTGLSEIIDINTGTSSSLSTPDQLKIETLLNHGVADDEYFMIKGIIGGLSYLNGGSLYQAKAASGNNLIYTSLRLNPESYINGSPSDALNIGTKSAFAKSGSVLKRTSSIGCPGNYAIGSTPASSATGISFRPIYNASFFERGLKFIDYKTISDEYSNGVVSLSAIPAIAGTSISTITGSSFSPASDHGWSFVSGFKQDIYFTTLPPVINNQLGDMDLNYVSLTSLTVDIRDSHQIGIRNLGESIDTQQDLVNDIPAITAMDQEAVRSEGRYSIRIIQTEENTVSKIRFYPEQGYPFIIKTINLRGERASRP